MSKQKLLAALLAILLLTGIFTACGNSGATSSTAPPASSGEAGGAAAEDGAAAPAATGAKTKYTLSICGINLEDGLNVTTKQPSEGYNTFAANQMKEAFPGLEITFNAIPWDNASGKIQTILMSNGTDLFTQGGAFIPEYYKEGLTQILDPFLEKDTEFVYEENFPAVFRENLNCTDYSGEHLLTLPWAVGNRSLIYDTQLFDEWGVEYLSEYPTPEEILEKAEKMTGINPVSGEQNYGLWIAGNSTNMSVLIPLAEHYGGAECTGNFDDPANLNWTLNSPEYVKAVQWMLDGAKFVPAAAATGQGYEKFGTANNDIAIAIDGPAFGGKIMGEYYNTGDASLIERFECTMHMGNNGGNWTPVDGMGMSAHLEGADADMAWELMKYMTGPEAAEWRFTNHGPMAIPHLVSTELYDDLDKYLAKNSLIAAQATHPGYEVNPFYGSTMQPTLASMISRAIAGEEVDAQKELDDLQTKAIAWSESKK